MRSDNNETSRIWNIGKDAAGKTDAADRLIASVTGDVKRIYM